jgi:threonine synthase
MLCPHSAVGVNAIEQLDMADTSTVCLATAHFAKFGDACKLAVDPLPEIPTELSRLWKMRTRSSDCPNDVKVVQAFLERRIEVRIASHARRDERRSLLRNIVLTSAAVGVVAMVIAGIRRR